MVKHSAAQILLKTKLVLFRMVTMCWTHPHHPPLAPHPFWLACTLATWHPGFMGNFSRLLTLGTTHLQVSSSREFLPQTKHILPNSTDLCATWNIQGPYWPQVLRWHGRVRVGELPSLKCQTTFLFYGCLAIGPWLHDVLFLGLGVSICKMEL